MLYFGKKKDFWRRDITSRLNWFYWLGSLWNKNSLMFLSGCQWGYKILFCNMRISHIKFKYQSLQVLLEHSWTYWFSYGRCVCLGKEIITTQQYFLCPVFKSLLPHPPVPSFVDQQYGILNHRMGGWICWGRSRKQQELDVTHHCQYTQSIVNHKTLWM